MRAYISPFITLSSVVSIVVATVHPRFIIELRETADLLDFYRSLDTFGAYEVHHEYTKRDLFHGASISLQSGQNAALLEGIPDVKAVYPVHLRSLRRSPSELNPLVARADAEATTLGAAQVPLAMIGADKVHEQGITGKGVKIGIIGVGIDYTIPSLGGGFGPGFKVAGGKDFVGDTFDGTPATLHPNPTPLDKCQSGTTSIAAIIAADSNNAVNITGVAPGAQLFVYRIFSCSFGNTDDIILQAIAQAAQETDILFFNSGAQEDWPEHSPFDILATRIAQMGKFFVTPATLAGQNGSLFTQAPGKGFGVINVGSAENLVIPVINGSSTPNPVGGLVGATSGRGPTATLQFRPHVVAPGTRLLSFGINGTARVVQGTGDACAFVAGAAALVLEAKGALDPHALRDILQSTAEPTPVNKDAGALLETATHAGSGIINVAQAVNFKTTISPATLLLNDSNFFQGSQSFTVHNGGSSRQSYTLKHIPAATSLTFLEGSIFPQSQPGPENSPLAATVKFQKISFSLNAGAKTTVQLTFTLPNTNKERLPFFSGFIQVVSRDEILRVAYLGTSGAMRDLRVIDNTSQFFGFPLPNILGPGGDPTKNPVPQAGPTNYTFANGDVPTFIYRLAGSTPDLKARLVSSDFNVTNKSLLTGAGTVGNIFDLLFQTRHVDIHLQFEAWSLVTIGPTFANGTTIPNGSYRILVQALRITGDKTKARDWEFALSPPFGVQVPSS